MADLNPALEDIFTKMPSIRPTFGFRSESIEPKSYRLLKRRTGELVLQGRYDWHQDDGLNGSEWRDIPTVVEEDSPILVCTPGTGIFLELFKEKAQ